MRQPRRFLCSSLSLFLLAALFLPLGAPQAQRLFVGIESAGVPTRSSDLAGFPDVSWDNHYLFEVSGAAATPEGDLYLCNGAFTTDIYTATLETMPQYVCTSEVDLSALAYGRGTLYGYSNYADPKGIYAIDPATGDATLVLDVYTGTSYRCFALDYNPVDDLFYGYTEYGETGLYSIDIDSGEMLQLAGRIPASNGQGRGMAVGNHTVYLTATRGDDDIPLFAYDLSQGPGGEWVPFTQPYPNYHSTGGAAWIPDPTSSAPEEHGRNGAGPGAGWQLYARGPQPLTAAAGAARIGFRIPEAADLRLDVCDATGRTVAHLFAGHLDAGAHQVEWRLERETGAPVSPGVYFAVLRAGTITRAHGLTVVR
ncbi:MAG: hypothetical protein GF330_10065 [Candidatus Eisenbacteria bacterium]|nr:hypothetical protein [Candidatus Eisenbacteria bacterium]